MAFLVRVPKVRQVAGRWLSIALLMGIAFGAGCKKRAPSGERPLELDAITQQARQLHDEQRQNDELLWKDEVRALAYAKELDEIVDAFRASRSRLSVLQGLSFGALRFRQPSGDGTSLGDGVNQRWFRGSPISWSLQDWQRWVVTLSKMPVKLEYLSLNLLEFEPAKLPGSLDQALVSLECHARSIDAEGEVQTATFHVWRGELEVTWKAAEAEGGDLGGINAIMVKSMEWQQRTGTPMFEPKLRYAIGNANDQQAVRITPIVVMDLDGDQRQDILLAGQNVLLRNLGDFKFRDEVMLKEPLRLRSSGTVADFNGDGHLDYLGFRADGVSVLAPGIAGGSFSGETHVPWKEVAEYPSALAVTDVDADGDLDVWMTQFRPTYHGGVLPDPFNDANDGFESRLYRNDGTAQFADVTLEVGLAGRSRRRTTSSSFTDLDDDGDPDLVVVSEWGGIEAYQNDGNGLFTELTKTLFPEWHMLGNGHAIGRFDEDDQGDVFVAGRWSDPVHRMNALGLERSDFPDFQQLALEIASGNRVFYSTPRRQETPGSVVNTGWSTSVVCADFDNDDDDDVYLTAGNVTGTSVENFDSQFWRHDVFLTEGVTLKARQRFFQTPNYAVQLAKLKTGEISWGGYQPNRLLLNEGGNFAEHGYLQGVALHQDSPGAVVADLDADGRVDILTIAESTFVDNKRLAVEQSLVVYRNASDADGHWLGVQLAPNAPGMLATGAEIRLVGSFGVRRRTIKTGGSAIAQGPNSVHFGLGKHEAVERLEILWGNGSTQVMAHPVLDQYLTIRPRLDFTPIPEPPKPEPPEEGTADPNTASTN